MSKPTYAQPTYADLWDAFVRGAEEMKMNPTATDKDIRRGADAYCKLVHQRLDPVMFEQLVLKEDK